MTIYESPIYLSIINSFGKQLTELPRRGESEYHFIIGGQDWQSKNQNLIAVCQWLKQNKYYLCTTTCVDERLHEAQAFKLYYVFSGFKNNDYIILEYAMDDPLHMKVFPSIGEIFPSAIPLEREMYELFGIRSTNEAQLDNQGVLFHTHLPDDLFPLRRTRTTAELAQRMKQATEQRKKPPPYALPEGMFIVPVGPIHAGIIEAGHFPFHVAGEMIEALPIQLGYKHRCIEKLFETDYNLENGWQLAEKVSGDSAFSHSLAYCQAIENLAGIKVPVIAEYWRIFLAELERMIYHITDVSGMVHDMAFDRLATPMSLMREVLVQLAEELTGSRLLRGINRPGGIQISDLDWGQKLQEKIKTISSVVESFLALSKKVLDKPSCRDRMVGIGVLTREEAKNATGLIRRASGDWFHDFRLYHPWSVYKESKVWKWIADTVSTSRGEKNITYGKWVPIFAHDLKGDVYARMAMRVAEVETSLKIILFVISKLIDSSGTGEPLLVPIQDALRKVAVLDIGIGCVEGWRGDVFYWVMKGPDNTIFRCQARDSSIFNWQVFPLAVVRKEKILKEKDKHAEAAKPKEYWENLLADFPLINKSFNLSYAGHDR